MSRFKNSISAAVSTLLVAMMVLAIGPVEAGAKTRKGKSAASTVKSQANYQPSGAHATRRARTARRSGILPYMEQDNIYRLRRP